MITNSSVLPILNSNRRVKPINSILFLLAGVFGAMVFSGMKPVITADQIINDYINVLGGAEKIASINNIYKEGTIVSSSGRKSTIKEWILNKKALRMENTFNGITSYLLVRADSGWTFNPGRGQRNSQPMSANQVAAYQPNLDIEGTLVNYKAKGYKVIYRGTEDIEGTESYKIEEFINDSLTKTFYIDPDSHYIMRVRSKSSMGGRVTSSGSDLSNYTKSTDGYIFPMEVGNTKYTLVKVNTTLNETLFKSIK